jgi:hypothetical protein
MNLLWTVLLAISPILLLIFVGQFRIKRRRRLAAAEVTEKKPFDLAPEASPNLFLRRFNSVNRTYIREQIPAARTGFCIITWLVFCAMTPSLFPHTVHRYQIEQSQSMAVWYSYLRASMVLGWLSVMIALLTAVVAGIGLTGKVSQATFFRTRPVTHRMLFWGRVLPALGTLLAGYAVGLGASLGLLVAFYGPVWNRLNISGLGMLLKLSHSHEIGWLLRSPWAIFISIAVSMIFIFSAVMAFTLQPFRVPNMPKPVQYLLGILVYMTFSVLGAHMLFPTLARFGLIPGSSVAQPPLSTDIFSLALSAVLLWIAQLAANRKETY